MKAGNTIMIEIGETNHKIPEGWKEEASFTDVKIIVNGEEKECKVIIGPKKHATDENILTRVMKDPFIHKNLR